MCHTRSRMCVCKNRKNSYPSCTIKEGSGCSEKCDEDWSYCNRESKQCMCKYGGLTLDTCCTQPCNKFQTCLDGKCRCAYGTVKPGRCRRCMDVCSRGEVCKKR